METAAYSYTLIKIDSWRCGAPRRLICLPAKIIDQPLKFGAIGFLRDPELCPDGSCFPRIPPTQFQSGDDLVLGNDVRFSLIDPLTQAFDLSRYASG